MAKRTRKLKKTRKRRNYKDEYKKFHSSRKAKKHRAMRNSANRKLKPGPGQEVDHKKPLSKGGSNRRGNLRVVSKKTNRRKGKK